MSILVVIPCHVGDQDQAFRMLSWIAELGKVHADAMLFCSRDCDVDSLMRVGQMAFSSIRYEADAENLKCNWQSNDPGPRDPRGPNSVFRQVAWSIYMGKKKGPWLFLEPDSVPLCPEWYSKLSSEYQACRKPVMGDLVSTNSPHLSGVAVYPYNVPELFPKMVHNVDGAFDTSEAKKVLAAAHITPLIMDRWRSPEFSDNIKPGEEGRFSDFNKIRPEAVLFHASKDGSLIPFIRRKLGMKGGDVNCTAQSTAGATQRVAAPNAPLVEHQGNGAAKSDPSSAPEIHELRREFVVNKEISKMIRQTDPVVDAFKHEAERFMTDPVLRSLGQKQTAPVVDIYLKTYPKDYELANYCLKSIAKFVTGYRRIIVEASRLDLHWGASLPVTMECCIDREPGYIDQQAKKLAAFKHTDADYLLYVDSDCCFQRPFDVSEMFRDGKSTWQYTPWLEARVDQLSAWGPVMEKFLGKPPAHEFMRRHPHIMPRWLPEEMDKFCRYRHGMTLDEYVMAQGDPSNPLQLSFSEFNCAGFFAWEFFRDRIAWVTDAEATPPPLVQGFTHGGTERIKSDIERAKAILGEDVPFGKSLLEVHSELVSVSGQELTTSSAISFLVDQARTDGFAKARILKQLKAAGLVKGARLKTRKPISHRLRKAIAEESPSPR